MIISVSRRTDIPAFYTDWFLKRVKEGYVDVINPYNSKLVNRVSLDPELVSCFVFWTKNPTPLLKRIDEITNYRYYFQFTLNGYKKDIEPFLPDKDELINTFIALSKKIGKEKVIWRYDPIFINDKYDISWHINTFKKYMDKLCNYTEKCVISFIDLYDKTKRNSKGLNIKKCTIDEMDKIAYEFSKIAKEHNISLATCSEKIDLNKYGIVHNKCIDDELINKLFNIEVTHTLDKQREHCGCVKCIDIGAYNTCLHKCRYCYANYNDEIINKNKQFTNLKSSALLGEVRKDAKIYVVKQEVVKKTEYEQLEFGI